MDDGDGKKGNVRAMKQDTPNPAPSLPRQRTYVEDGVRLVPRLPRRCRFVRLPQPVFGCGERLRRAEQHDHIAGLQRAGRGRVELRLGAAPPHRAT